MSGKKPSIPNWIIVLGYTLAAVLLTLANQYYPNTALPAWFRTGLLLLFWAYTIVIFLISLFAPHLLD